MLIVHVFVHVKPECIDAFIARFAEKRLAEYRGAGNRPV